MKYNRTDDSAELLDRLAASYVFGTSGSRARRRFERLVRSNAAAARALQSWEARSAALSAAIPPVSPPPGVWARIEQRIGPAPQTASRRWAGWLRPALGFAFGLIAMVGLVRWQPQWVLPSDLPPKAVLPASYVGLLLDASGRPAALASSLKHGAQISVKLLQPLALPAGKVAILWALPDKAPPFVLARLGGDTKQLLTMPGSSEALLASVNELAVSVEDAAGTPASPAAPFLLRGHCVKLW
ncbi:MAG TPA: anti-sigma factor [Methyloversatilis sp.]